MSEYEPSMKKGDVVVAGGRLWFFGRGKTPNDRPDIMLLDDFTFQDALKLRNIMNDFLLSYIGLNEKSSCV